MLTQRGVAEETSLSECASLSERALLAEPADMASDEYVVLMWSWSARARPRRHASMRADDESIESRVVVERIKRVQAARLRAERLVQVGEIGLGEDGAAEQRLRVLVGARLELLELLELLEHEVDEDALRVEHEIVDGSRSSMRAYTFTDVVSVYWRSERITIGSNDLMYWPMVFRSFFCWRARASFTCCMSSICCEALDADASCLACCCCEVAAAG